jgi:hypothetical protein
MEIIMNDDEDQTRFGNLDLGSLNDAHQKGEIDEWNLREKAYSE